MTVAELGRRMSAREFFDWHAFAALHPFPADLADHHGAMLAAILANVNRSANSPPRDVRDFSLIRDRPREPVKTGQPMTEAQRIRLALGR